MANCIKAQVREPVPARQIDVGISSFCCSDNFKRPYSIAERKVTKNLPLNPFLNKAGYTATEVACGWAGAIFEVTRPFRQ